MKRLLREIPDFPEPGVLFRDITPVLADPDGLRAVVEGMVEMSTTPLDVVAGIEARGFVLGTPIAMTSHRGFVAIRKKGKLPQPTMSVAYDLEYGQAEVEIGAGAIEPGSQVVVVDDVLATGGTAEAACRLVEQAGASVVNVVFLMELAGLGGREKLGDRQVNALLTLD